MATWWGIMVIALAVRRLPYALRACVAALQQVSLSLEEAAESLGASKWSTIKRVVVPLMTGGILAGFVTSFATAAVELSATIMLVAKEGGRPSRLRYLRLYAICSRTRSRCCPRYYCGHYCRLRYLRVARYY